MALRPPIVTVLGVAAAVVKVHKQYRNQNIYIPVTAWMEDPLLAFEYAAKEAGVFATVPPGEKLVLEGVQPDEDGTLFWVRSLAGTPSLVTQTEENRSRNR